MKDYSKMSDEEINEAVYTLLVSDESYPKELAYKVYHLLADKPDYCNNPSDAWTIIFVNDIMLNPNCVEALWKAEQGFREKPSGFYSAATAYSNNPLRAAMIVYLMMKDEEK